MLQVIRVHSPDCLILILKNGLSASEQVAAYPSSHNPLAKTATTTMCDNGEAVPGTQSFLLMPLPAIIK